MSLPGEDVAFLDAYAVADAFPSRSAVIRQAVRALRLDELGAAYGQAWDAWNGADEAIAWQPADADGLL